MGFCNNISVPSEYKTN